MIVKARGRDIDIQPVRDSFSRRVQQFQNRIITALKKLGVHEDDIEFSEVKMPLKKAESWLEWTYSDAYCFVSHCRQANYADNMQVLAKLIEMESESVASGETDIDGFTNLFREDENILEKRKEARKLLEVSEDCLDIGLVNQNYKRLSKKAHPDMGGSIEDFKKLNAAHKVLKRELE